MYVHSWFSLWDGNLVETFCSDLCHILLFLVFFLVLIFFSYSAWLSIYFYLLLGRQRTEQEISKWLEPLAHVTALLIAASTASAALQLDLYNNANLWCWIAPLPAECNSDSDENNGMTCIRGSHANLYRWVFYFIPLWTCIVTSTLAIFAVYQRAKTLEQTTRHAMGPQSSAFSFMSKFHLRASLMAQPSVGSLPDNNNNNNSHDPSWNSNQSERANPSSAISEYEDNDDNDEDGHDEIASNLADATASQYDDDAVDMKVETSPTTRSRLRRSQDGPVDDALAEQPPTARSATTTITMTTAKSNSQQILAQSTWYLAAFYLTNVCSTINRALQLSHGGHHTYFALLVLHAMLDPLQGFLNFLVYRRPIYMRYRRQQQQQAPCNDNAMSGQCLAWYLALRWHFTFNAEKEHKQWEAQKTNRQRNEHNNTNNTSSGRRHDSLSSRFPWSRSDTKESPGSGKDDGPDQAEQVNNNNDKGPTRLPTILWTAANSPNDPSGNVVMRPTSRRFQSWAETNLSAAITGPKARPMVDPYASMTTMSKDELRNSWGEATLNSSVIAEEMGGYSITTDEDSVHHCPASIPEGENEEGSVVSMPGSTSGPDSSITSSSNSTLTSRSSLSHSERKILMLASNGPPILDDDHDSSTFDDDDDDEFGHAVMTRLVGNLPEKLDRPAPRKTDCV